MTIGKPHLFIEYSENEKRIKLGPYYTARPDGMDIGKWMAYEVQDGSFQFRRVTVPWYHTVKAIAF